MPGDYSDRRYLSAIEAAKYLGISVKFLHGLVRDGSVEATISTSGQKRFDIEALKKYDTDRKRTEAKSPYPRAVYEGRAVHDAFTVKLGDTTQTVYFANAQEMSELEDGSVHLMVTSPPYFDTKMYSRVPVDGDLGNLHDLEGWFEQISRVWAEVFRVLVPGRKAFINIMNLPIREKGTFRSLNLVGRTIDVCQKAGFIFKRDIVWHKTNGVRAHFGTYPYPGGILLNNMHEFILEFQKPEKKGVNKYAHLTDAQREASRLTRDFWLAIKNSDVWLMKPEKSGDRRIHVAPFPYELPYRIIKAYSFLGETVLDPFCGSGMALKAAADLGRSGTGYEIIPEFRESIKEVLGRNIPAPDFGHMPVNEKRRQKYLKFADAGATAGRKGRKKKQEVQEKLDRFA